MFRCNSKRVWRRSGRQKLNDETRSEIGLFSYYETDGIVVKINIRKLQLIREKSY